MHLIYNSTATAFCNTDERFQQMNMEPHTLVPHMRCLDPSASQRPETSVASDPRHCRSCAWPETPEWCLWPPAAPACQYRKSARTQAPFLGQDAGGHPRNRCTSRPCARASQGTCGRATKEHPSDKAGCSNHPVGLPSIHDMCNAALSLSRLECPSLKAPVPAVLSAQDQPVLEQFRQPLGDPLPPLTCPTPFYQILVIRHVSTKFWLSDTFLPNFGYPTPNFGYPTLS